MKLEVLDDRGVTIIAVSGEIDASNSAQLGELLDKLLHEGHRRLVVDLKDVGFIDSSGLATLVRSYKHARGNNGDIALAALQPPVRRAFELTRLNRVFEVHSEVVNAVQKYTSG